MGFMQVEMRKQVWMATMAVLLLGTKSHEWKGFLQQVNKKGEREKNEREKEWWQALKECVEGDVRVIRNKKA